MNAVFKSVVTGLVLMAGQAVGHAGERGSAQEATALVQRAAAYMKANGKDRLLAEASKQKGQFIDRDLYLSVYDMNGKVLAHGANARLVGIDATQVRDADQKYFVQEILSRARTAGTGWVDYKWVDPVSKKIEDKATYLLKSGDVVIASGYYKQ
ncbi:MAG: cache domain-containing protein [Pseudomonadota bacterium]